MSVKSKRPLAALVVPALAVVATIAALVGPGDFFFHDESPDVVFSVVLCLVLALPYLLGALALILGRSVVGLWWSALVYCVLAGVFGIIVIGQIVTTDDAQAAIGYIFLPVYQLIAIVPILGVGTAIGELVKWQRRRRRTNVPA